jgi:hypothetical protein
MTIQEIEQTIKEVEEKIRIENSQIRIDELTVLLYVLRDSLVYRLKKEIAA